LGKDLVEAGAAINGRAAALALDDEDDDATEAAAEDEVAETAGGCGAVA
jgi:hypothetical protein